MSKKKILFIMESMRIGGAEKSLSTILNMFDYDEYDVDLYLFEHHGPFLSMIPKQVHLLEEPKKYRTFCKNRKLSPLNFLLEGDFKSSLHAFLWLLGVFKSKVLGKKLYTGWNQVRYFFCDVSAKYDTSIAFMERKTIYFNIDKVNAKNKIGFIHNDISVYPYEDKLDREYFYFYDHIVTVSDHCKEVLENFFPEYQDKFLVIKNMVSKDLIKKMALEKVEDIDINENNLNIVSVGRLVEQKGIDIAVKICKRLIDKGVDVKWYVVGDGPERNSLEKIIKENDLQVCFYLVGADINPYRWMNIADVYVQPSRFEGFGITVAEAMCLEKRIVASDISEFRELLQGECLCKTEEEFAEKILSLAHSKNKVIYDNITDENRMERLYEII